MRTEKKEQRKKKEEKERGERKGKRGKEREKGEEKRKRGKKKKKKKKGGEKLRMPRRGAPQGLSGAVQRSQRSQTLGASGVGARRRKARSHFLGIFEIWANLAGPPV